MGMGSPSGSVPAPAPPDPKQVSNAQWKGIIKYMPKILSKDFSAQKEYMPKMLDLLNANLPDQQKLTEHQLRNQIQTFQKFAPDIANGQNKLALDQYKQYGQKFANQNADLADYNAQRANRSDFANFQQYTPKFLQAANQANIDQYAKYSPQQAQLAREQQQIFDPTAFAAREAVGNAVQKDLALGTGLSPQSEREWQQDVRGAQAARGNVLGSAPITSEAMTTGRAGQALYQQRLQNAGAFGNTLSGPLSIAQINQTSTPAIRQTQQGVAPNYMPPSMSNSGLNIGLPGASMPQSFTPQYFNAGMIPQTDALGGYNASLAASQANRAGQTNPWLMAGTGAVGGAAIGTQLYPGIGTAIGAGVGALGGGLIGAFS